MPIRDARPDDLRTLQQIEVAAGELFREVGMAEIADDDPPSLERLDGYRAAGLAWVAAGESDSPVAYLIGDEVDGNLHIEQVSVLPSHAGHGLGRALIDHADREAARRRLPALTLTTFEQVAWNAPYYARCGFDVIPHERQGAGLREIRAQESRHGLDQWPRVAMIRPVTTEP